MAWHCRDCGEEMKPEFLSERGDSKRRMEAPREWQTYKPYGSPPRAWHFPCDGAPGQGVAVWIPAPKPGVVEALEGVLNAAKHALPVSPESITAWARDERDVMKARSTSPRDWIDLGETMYLVEEAKRCGK